MIGGSGEKKTLRLVAKYADACNLFVDTPEEATHKLTVLGNHCEAEGTDYDTIHKTVLYTGMTLVGGDDAGFIAEMGALAAVGIQEVQVMPFGPDPVALIQRVGSTVVPALQAL